MSITQLNCELLNLPISSYTGKMTISNDDSHTLPVLNYFLIYGDCIPWTILLVTNSAVSDCVLKMPAEGKPSYPHPQGTFLPLENLLQFDKVGNSLAKPIRFTKNLPPSQKVFSSLTKCQLRVLWIVLLTMVVPLVSLFFFSFFFFLNRLSLCVPYPHIPSLKALWLMSFF